MLIALDYDGTYTEDPEFWDLMIMLAQSRGHRVFLVTMRHSHEQDDMPAKLLRVVTPIFTGRKAKHAFVRDAGIEPDVWIDDQPHFLFQDG